MPEDKRTIKTKRNLKLTLMQMLKNTSFERITISELCRQGLTSRITFYTHYEDKYALAAELFGDFAQIAVEDYHRLQAANNPEKAVVQGYYNMLDCILNLYYSNLELFSMASPQKNAFLYASFYHQLFHTLEKYVEKHSKQMPHKYSARQTAALLCNGLLGVINECYDSTLPPQKLRNDVREMYRDILMSPIFEAPKKG